MLGDEPNAFAPGVCRCAAMNGFSEAAAAEGGHADRNFRPPLTGKPLPVATSAQLGVAVALSMHPRASLPARFASLDPLCSACSLV